MLLAITEQFAEVIQLNLITLEELLTEVMLKGIEVRSEVTLEKENLVQYEMEPTGQ